MSSAALLALLFCSCAFAQFASIKSSKVNARYGPGGVYPLKFTYLKHNIPVKILQSFEGWDQIEDIDGEKSWIKESFISKKSYAMTKSCTVGYKKIDYKPVVKIDDGIVALVKQCKQNWCYIQVEKYKIWVKKPSLWGVN